MSSFTQALIEFLSDLDGLTAYGAIFGLLLVCGLGVPLPEDITLIGAGILASPAFEAISLPGAIAVGMVGVLAGDAFMYFLGRIFGRRAFELPLIRTILPARRVAMAERRVLRNSKFICFTARFLPGLRSPIFLTVGTLGVRPLIFFALDGLAALISVPFWIFVGHWVGANMDTAAEYIEKMQITIIAVIVTAVVSYLLFKRFRKVRRAKNLMRAMRGTSSRA